MSFVCRMTMRAIFCSFGTSSFGFCCAAAKLERAQPARFIPVMPSNLIASRRFIRTFCTCLPAYGQPLVEGGQRVVHFGGHVRTTAVVASRSIQGTRRYFFDESLAAWSCLARCAR